MYPTLIGSTSILFLFFLIMYGNDGALSSSEILALQISIGIIAFVILQILLNNILLQSLFPLHQQLQQITLWTIFWFSRTIFIVSQQNLCYNAESQKHILFAMTLYYARKYPLPETRKGVFVCRSTFRLLSFENKDSVK